MARMDRVTIRDIPLTTILASSFSEKKQDDSPSKHVVIGRVVLTLSILVGLAFAADVLNTQSTGLVVQPFSGPSSPLFIGFAGIGAIVVVVGSVFFKKKVFV